MNINTSEETYRFEEIKCSEMFGGGWSCNYNQQPTNLQLSEINPQNASRRKAF
jgi:hypothetical protein